MPVFLEDHNPEIDLRPGTTKSKIVAYLYQNTEWGYSPQDIKEALDIPRGTATTTLKRLYEDDEYIGKTEDGYYHALNERDDIHRYVSSLDQVHRMFGHHREDATPEVPETQIGEGRTDEDLDTELEELENDSGDLNE